MTQFVPTISIVMSVHNGEKYLREAVESILNQTFRDFEFIIIDDGSTDHSKPILEEYAAKDSRVRLISHENRGLTKCLNEGLTLARGEFIARMDADDVSLSRRFEKQVEFLNSYKDYVIVGAEVLMVDEDGDPLCFRGHRQEHELIERECLLGNGGALTHPAIMVRKLALNAIDGYDIRFVTAQDLDLYLRLCEVGKAFNLPEVLLHWRQHPESVNRTKYDTWSHMKSLAINNAIQRRGVEAYIQGVFYLEGAWMQQEYAKQCLGMARSGKNYRNAMKHLRRVLSKEGLTLWGIQQWVLICEGIIKKMLRSLCR